MRHGHNPILSNFIRSNVRAWKIWIVQASPWCVEPCSGGLDLQELRKISTLESKGGPHWKNEFTEVPPLVHRQKNFFSSWRSTPLEHGSTHHGEAWTIQIFHVLTFDLIKLAKIGLCRLLPRFHDGTHLDRDELESKKRHSPILANFIRSSVRTWKIWIVQASP